MKHFDDMATLTLKVHFKRKRTNPFKNQPTGLCFAFTLNMEDCHAFYGYLFLNQKSVCLNTRDCYQKVIHSCFSFRRSAQMIESWQWDNKQLLFSPIFLHYHG